MDEVNKGTFTFTIVPNYELVLFGRRYKLCKDVDIDRDIDFLITGACLVANETQTEFLISTEILEAGR